jgi:hypothetical protein
VETYTYNQLRDLIKQARFMLDTRTLTNDWLADLSDNEFDAVVLTITEVFAEVQSAANYLAALREQHKASDWWRRHLRQHLVIQQH